MCTETRHADINKRQRTGTVAQFIMKQSLMQVNGAQPLTSVYHVVICTAFLEFRSLLSFFMSVRIHMTDAGPTQEVTPPCSPVQNSPLPSLQGRKRHGASGERLHGRGPRSLSICPPLKRLHCSWESQAREGAKESYEACRRGRGC